MMRDSRVNEALVMLMETKFQDSRVKVKRELPQKTQHRD